MSEKSNEAPAADKTAGREHDALNQEAEQAKEAIVHALHQAQAALRGGVDPVTWARRYPVISLGAALVGGFAAAVVAVPSKEDQEIRRLRKLHEAMHPPIVPTEKMAEGNGKPAEHQSIWSGLVLEAVRLLRPLLTAGLGAVITSMKESHNGSANGSVPADGQVHPGQQHQ